jgi:hypothetical protein
MKKLIALLICLTMFPVYADAPPEFDPAWEGDGMEGTCSACVNFGVQILNKMIERGMND